MRAARSKYTIAFSATCIALADIEHEHGEDDDDDLIIIMVIKKDGTCISMK